MYIVKYIDQAPFKTDYFHAPNMWVDGMFVVNLQTDMYYNGKKWIALAVDHL